MTSNPPSGTVTFLFTDIEGSTSCWELYPEWMAHAFARQEAILRGAAAAHGGYVYKMIGDAFQIAFETASNALAAAIDAQRALQAEAWGDHGPLKVRMALHTGVTEEREDDYVGPILNRLGRLLSVSHGGQILLSQATYELISDFLPEDVDLLDLGTHRLKDLIRPEHIYQVTAPDLPSEFRPIQSLDFFQHNLPLQLTSFIGREREITQVKRLVLGDRFVTLTGPGGTGKTRLALQIAAELLELFPDGVWLVELAAISDSTLVPNSVAAVLGIRESSGRPILNLLIEYLRNKEMLLILDNCEHLLSACAQLATTLLQVCPNLCLLVTSRESLEIPGEVPFRVPSLSAPDARRIPPIEKLIQYESVRLFVERAEIIQPDFALTYANASPVAQICHRLDGIPLAIELAVARVKMMPVEQVAARLDDRFRLLTGGSRTALPRHQTLRALIDWSHDLLSEAERTLFQRLSVFAGGWTLEAAEAICIGEGLEQYDILDLLTQLVNKSLVIPDHESDKEMRYRLLETIRQYAREKLLEAGGGEKVRERHLDYALQLVERAEPELRGPNQVMWLNRLEKEVDNVRAALEWAVEAHVLAGLRMSSALLWFWHIRSRKSEGIDWLERVLSANPREGDDATPALDRALIRGKALNAAGSLLVMHGNPQRGGDLSNESLALHRDLGPVGRPGVAHALWNLAQGAAHRENIEEAQKISEQALALYRELNDKFGIAQCLDNLGSHRLLQGDYEQAKMLWEEDLVLRRELGDKDGIGWILTCLGELAFWEGDLEKSMSLYVESRNAFREVGNQWAVSMTISGMGSIVLAQGEFDQAARFYEEALAFGREMGDLNAMAGRRYDLARVAWSRGDYDQAEKFYEESLEFVRREMHNQGAVAGILYELGEVAWAKGNLDLATKRHEEALAIGREIGAKFTIAAALKGLGKVACARVDYQKSESLHKEALSLLQRTGNRWSTLYTLEDFTTLTIMRGDMEPAVRLLGATAAFYDQIRFLMSPIEREQHERNLEAVRAALSSEVFEAGWAEGQAMTLEQAIAYALEV
ncbi:MAG TPA: tetratricopeptide repeat protein [Anaerolineales bacterium]|nr:tetratricopeptide repeat protein [Anaerolineales bacterium]